MADPQAYRITYSFGGYQASNPTRPLPAPQVDNEFANIQTAIGQLVAAIKDVRRADGAVQNSAVTFDSLANEIRLLFNNGAVDNATLLANAVSSSSASAVSAAASAAAAAAASGLDPALVLAGAALDQETVFASASTTNIGGSATTRVRVDGTTTITSLGTVAKRLRIVRYNGAVQINHDATALVLIGGANRIVAIGDQSLFMSDATGNWRELLYSKADGSPLAFIDRSITYAKLQNASGVGIVIGRKTAGSGIFEECSLTDVLDMVTGTAQGDILFRGASAWKRLGAGSAGQYIQSGGPGADLSYQSIFGRAATMMPLLHVAEEQAQGVGAQGSYANSAWTTKILNASRTTEITAASLASNQITLPAGTYFIEAEASVDLSDGGTGASCKIRLRNITDGLTVLYGKNTRGFGNGIIMVYTSSQRMSGRFTLAGTKVLELQHYAVGAQPSIALSQGVEVYTDVKIWRIA